MLKSNKNNFVTYYEENPILTIAIFMLAYIVVAALSIPGVTILTVLAGSLFGLLQGTTLVSFASTIGATLAFLVCRFLLRDFVEKNFSRVLGKVNEGIAKEGNRYLFALRLVPGFSILCGQCGSESYSNAGYTLLLDQPNRYVARYDCICKCR